MFNNALSYLRWTFIKGVIALLPIAATFFIITWVASTLEKILSGPIRAWLPPDFYIPGSGITLGIILILIVGVLVDNYLTVTFFKQIEKILQKIPLFTAIYNPLKEMIQLFTRAKSESEKQRVVFVRLPALGVEAVGFITRDQFKDLPKNAIPEEHVAVYIPMSYAFGGYTIIVPKTLVRDTQIPAERALQLALTGWIQSSKDSKKKNN